MVEGQVALVTGAGQGMGRGIALALAAEGARVALVGRTPAKLDAVVTEVADRGGEALAVAADVSDRDAAFGAVATVLERWDRLDTLVNAAYDSRVGLLDDLDADDARHDWQTGFAATLWCIQAAHPALAASGGSVVNVGAATGLKPDTTTFALYASTKEAIRSLTRTAACELAADGIRVNALIPLATSPSFSAWADDNPDDYQVILDTIPLGRMGDAETDVGPAAVFLASEAAHYVTGTTFLADGGRGYLR